MTNLFERIAAKFNALRQRTREQRVAAMSVLETPSPPGLFERWNSEFPSRNRPDFDLAYRGLLSYLAILRLAKDRRARRTVLPSSAADSVWHVLLQDAPGYERFCLATVGWTVKHIPRSEDTAPAAAALAYTWKLACELDGVTPKAPQRLPLLFALDALLEWSGGHIYRLDEMRATRRIFLGMGSDPTDVTALLLLTVISSSGDSGSGSHSCGGHSCGGAH